MTTKIHIDFETRSTIDLRKTGVYAYAAHPSTEIQCMAWAVDDGPIGLWTPGTYFPESLWDVIYEADPRTVEFWAHNANFERIIWRDIMVKRLGTPSLGLHDWHCSAAQCAAMGLPRSLDKAAEALGLIDRKDKAGHSLMMRLSRPRSTDPTVWWDDPEKLERLYAYCRQDVRVEREIEEYTRRLDDDERETYLLDQRMNDIGVRADVPLIHAAKSIALEGIARANLVIAEHTNGEVERVTQVARMQKWLEGQGYDVESLAKSNVAELLRTGNLTYPVEQVLTARSEAGKSSVAKLDTMLNGLVGDRLQGLLLHHGAHTGRWAGRRVQPQNFPRPTVENVERYLPNIMGGEYDAMDLIDNPVDIISSMLRGIIIGDPELYVGDYSAIEAIVLAWLAGQDDLVDRFATRENVYLVEGQRVGATRQHGKAIILGCGFGMGPVKFVDNARDVFGLDLTFAQADSFVQGYRDRYTKIVAFWYALQNAFVGAIETPEQRYAVGRLTVLRKGRYIWLTLPSGRPLCYVRPELDSDNNITIMRTDSQTGKMARRRIWGGVLAENVTQAVARDIMVAGMKRLEGSFYQPVLTVHDEIICEPNINCYPSLENFLSIMSYPPEWADGLPVFADGFVAERYRKG